MKRTPYSDPPPEPTTMPSTKERDAAAGGNDDGGDAGGDDSGDAGDDESGVCEATFLIGCAGKGADATEVSQVSAPDSVLREILNS